MISPQAYAECSEFYEVAKTVEFVMNYGGENRRFRINALLNLATGRYSTSAYISESVTLQPTFPQTAGQFERKPEDMQIWIVFSDIGWTDRSTAEAAIEQALGFLGGS